MTRLEQIKFRLSEEKKKVRYLKQHIRESEKRHQKTVRQLVELKQITKDTFGRIRKYENTVNILQGFFTDLWRIERKRINDNK